MMKKLTSASVYKQRRNNLSINVKTGAILLLGNEDQSRNFPSNLYNFRQDSSFLYFTGISKPGLALLILPGEGSSILFGTDATMESIIWSGKETSLHQMAEKAGIEKTEDYSKLSSYLEKHINQKHKIHFFKPYQSNVLNKLANLLSLNIEEINKNQSVELIKAIINLREIKDAFEIEQIESTLHDATSRMFNQIKGMAREGEKEVNILASITDISLRHANGLSFTPILSVNGEILHNPWYKNRLNKGQLLIADAGAESAFGYATDITRTYPVNGEFNTLQKEIFDIVLNTLQKSIDIIKSGITYKEVHFLACKTMVEGLKNIGLMKGNTEDIVLDGAHALFFPHGLGHMMGLDVHDMENLGEDYVGYDESIQRSTQFGTAYLRLGKKLKENMVITVEPGIYFIPALIEKWKNENKFSDIIMYDQLHKYTDFGGIRIEDDVLVTNAGCRVLSHMIPW